jgi:radical SAM superfamily enzyme YgiQ (UPF0313 family)
MTGTARRHGIQVGLFVMLGYEGEEIADLEATVDHLKRAAPDLFLTTVAYPIRGTPYYREVESRLIDRLPWEKGSDRDLGVGGRHSRRFYRYANRWMVNEVMASQRWNGPRRDYAGAAKAFLSARLGRWGMRLASREREE